MKVEPDVAVILANGKEQAVGVDQYFKAGDIWFQLLAVGAKTVEISVVGGEFAGGKNSITISRDHPVTLVNTATGVEYPLRFMRGATGIATTASDQPIDETATTAAPAATPPSPTPAATTPETTTTPATETAPAAGPGATTTTTSGS
jgi:hypothetical protein